MEFVYMCLLAIALVLRHLHTAKLAHCDFKPGNVLLRSSPWDARDFVCKLGDFRYAAILKDGLLPGRPAVLPEEACVTLQYMAPELFVAGRPVDASIDISLRHAHVGAHLGPHAVQRHRVRQSRPDDGGVPRRASGVPQEHAPRLQEPGHVCWSGDPTLRPNAVKLLRQQLESLKQHWAGMSAAAAAVARSNATSHGNGGGGGSSNSTAAHREPRPRGAGLQAGPGAGLARGRRGEGFSLQRRPRSRGGGMVAGVHGCGGLGRLGLGSDGASLGSLGS